MFSLRCLILVFLIIALVVAVFYVQEAKADECDTAMKECGQAQIAEIIACFGSRSNSKACIQAKGRAVSKCLQAVIICQN